MRLADLDIPTLIFAVTGAIGAIGSWLNALKGKKVTQEQVAPRVNGEMSRKFDDITRTLKTVTASVDTLAQNQREAHESDMQFRREHAEAHTAINDRLENIEDRL